MMKFKKHLRAEMELTETTVKELAYKTGISQSTLNNYLGKHPVQPTLKNGVKIARALGITAERLVYGEEEAADSKELRAVIGMVRKLSPSGLVNLSKLLKPFVPD
jgi:transcriptional regulator with XRE-family HTH domain